jgi:tyrosinase
MAFVRKDIWTLDPDDPIITWYRHAVGVMKERSTDPTDATSWGYQAAIHGIPQGHGSEPLWNQCQHEQWYFLPWHRMYCLRFEEIVRAVIVADDGPKDWALPYWNYIRGGKEATLPLPFREPQADGGKNHLYVEARAPGMNSGNGAIDVNSTLLSIAMRTPAFVGRSRFGGGDHEPSHHFAGKTGLIEQTPHNEVHGEIGGEHGLMSFPDLAANDPIFWLHHANIDRLWERWKESEATPSHDDPSDSLWTGQSFELFDGKGDPTALKCEAVEDTKVLGYEYDPSAPREALEPPPSPPPPPTPALAPEAEARGEAVLHTKPHLVGATSKPIELVGEPVTVEIPIDAREAGDLSPEQHVYLNTENIEGERNPGTVYYVYVEGSPDVASEKPGAHLVGSLSFFGIERTGNPPGDANPHGLRFAAEITRIAQELADRGEWGGHSLYVSLEPQTLKPTKPEHRDELEGPEHRERPITIGRLSVFYDAA